LKNYDINSRYGRIAGLVDVHALASKRVTFIGLGSMGQPISTQMARHGVATSPDGMLCLIDGDIVSERNLIGTEYRPQHLSMHKAEAAVRIVKEVNPDSNVSFWNRMITEKDIPAITQLAQQSDLLCLFADSFDLMLQISETCSNICPHIIAAFGQNADYAEIAFSLPGVTPTLKQTMGQRKRKAISNPTALGCDTIFITSFVAAVCIRLLLGEAQGKDLMPCYSNAPLFIMGLRNSWIFENQPVDIARTIIRVKVN
jgi:molybdopterin/thiamine biosynthesis adenylyltransferase